MNNQIDDAKLILKKNGRSFFWASKFLPSLYVNRASELYKFCRILDDIADSGVTLTNAPGIYTAVLHYKPHTSVFKPDLYSVEYKGDDFLQYPWETDESEPIADYLKK